MRKLFYLVVSIVIFGLIISGCIFHVVPPLGQDGSIDIVKNDVFCKIDLIAGQHTIAGSITVSNDDENLFVTYETVDSWLINETHLYVGTTIPTKSEPGKFPYKHEELGGVTTDTYEIPLDDLGIVPCDIVYIAAHAELIKGETEETGWAEGEEIRPGKNWAMYFEYQITSYYEHYLQIGHEAIEKAIALTEQYGKAQAYQTIVDYLLEKEGISSAGVNPSGECVWYQLENGFTFSFSEYPQEGELTSGKAISNKVDSLKRDISRNTTNNKRAIVLDWEIDRIATIYANDIKDLLNDAGYEVEPYPRSDFTIEKLQSIYQYGVVYISSHGYGGVFEGIPFGKQLIVTGQIADIVVMNHYREVYGFEQADKMIGVHSLYNIIGSKIGDYFCIYPEFIRYFADQPYPGSLIYADVCEGLGTDGIVVTDMAEAFIDEGAYVYCSHNGITLTGCMTDLNVFKNLINDGMNIHHAILYSGGLGYCAKIDYYPEDHGDFYLVDGGQEKFPEIGAWTITGYDPYCIKVFGTENIPDRSILVHWPKIAGAEEYRVYRSVNGNSNFSLVYSGDYITDELDVDDRVGWYDFDTTPGNSYSYKVSCVINGQESTTSDPVTRSVWLPECSLVSPPDYNPEDPYDQPAIEPDPLLEWNPVGVSGYPYQRDIQSGKSQIWVVAYDTNYPEPDQGEQIWEESFNNLTTSSTRFDPDVAREPLVPGSDHIYAWETKGIGYDYNEDIIAMSWSGARHFFYMEAPDIIEPPVDNIRGISMTRHGSRSRTTSCSIENNKSSQVQIYSKELLENNTLSRGDIFNYIWVIWDSYPDCNGYRLYRSTNGSEYEMILNWDTTGSTASGFGFYDSNIEQGNLYAYYVIAFNSSENWETVPSNIYTIEIDNETFLPPIYLNQPQDYGLVDDPNYLFKWTPVGDILPYGEMVSGNTQLQIGEYDSYLDICVTSFNDLTTAQFTCDWGLVNAKPGNTYRWNVISQGLDESGNIISSSKSEQWQFTYTGSSIESPTVTTLEAYTITKTAATLWGEIISTGGLAVTRKGFEYKDSAGGSTFDWHEDGDWSTHDYIHRITSLVAGHTYLYRAYAVNDKGTGYGSWESFKTTEEIITSPSVTTVGADNIQEMSVRFIGRIDDTGGEDADWRGFRITDTVTGNKFYFEQDNGPYGTGEYKITVTGLQPGRTYEYEARAHNSAGTSYGTKKSVTTKTSKQLTSIESSISSVSLRWPQMLMPMDYTITAHYSDGSSADIWHINCTWSSSKPNSVHVNEGIITPLVKTADFAVVTMKYTEGGITKSDTIAVTVLPYP